MDSNDMLVDVKVELVNEDDKCTDNVNNEFVGSNEKYFNDKSLMLDSKQQDDTHCKALERNQAITNQVDETHVLLKCENVTFQCTLCSEEFVNEDASLKHICTYLKDGDGDASCDTSHATVSSSSSHSSLLTVNKARGRSRVRGVRTRGGTGGTQPVPAAFHVAAPEDAGRGRSRGRSRGRGRSQGRGRGGGHGGGANPHPEPVNELQIMDIREHPQDKEPLEAPLFRRRKRRWQPCSSPERSGASPAPQSEAYTGPSTVSASVVSASVVSAPTSPGTFLQVGTGRSSPAPVPPPGRPRPPADQPLRDDDIAYFLHYGSESSDDSGDEQDGELVVPNLYPRRAAILQETPLDGDEDIILPAVNTAADTSPSSSSPNLFDFSWKTFPDPPLDSKQRREPFSESNAGPTTPCSVPYDIFTAIWDLTIIGHIVSETNRYARQQIDLLRANGMLRPKSRIAQWRDTTTDELFTYIAITLAMGNVIKVRLEDYWSTCQNIFCTPYFRAYMSLTRYQMLNKCLHFVSNEDLDALNLGVSEAKLFKVKPVVEHLNRKFQQMYNLRQNIALDETLLQWKGSLCITPHIPNKAAAIGIRTYEVCECQSGYLWRFEIHAHKKLPQEPSLDPMEAFTPKLVLGLLNGLENKGHTVWMDSFYNSPALARKLKALGFDCVGTLRTNREFVPRELSELTKEQMRPGAIAGFTSGDVDVMVWRDKNRVATLSTYHGNSVTTLDGVTKPNLILDYSVMMGAVDKKDRMLGLYPVERKRTRVWYKKFFRRLLNVSVLNAYIICKSSSSDLDHHRFRESLIVTLLEKHATNQIVARTPQNVSVEFHHLAGFPLLPGKSQRQRRVCNICKKRVQTYCVGCDKAVCMTPCFVKLHVS